MSYKRTFIASAFMIFGILVCQYLNHVEDIRPKKAFTSFPSQIADWTGKEERFGPQIDDVLGVDDYYLANFQRPDGRRINLYVGYYRSQKKGDLIHSPKNCMPGAGWGIVQTSVEEIAINKNDSSGIDTIKLMLQKGEKNQIVLYWFQSRGRFIASEYMQKIYLVLDSITRHRTDGSFVRLTAPVSVQGHEETLESLKGFASLLVPILQDYLPS